MLVVLDLPIPNLVILGIMIVSLLIRREHVIMIGFESKKVRKFYLRTPNCYFIIGTLTPFALANAMASG